MPRAGLINGPAAALVTAVALLVFAPSATLADHGPSDATFCQYQDTLYLCGEIWVELTAETDASIEEVVERHGGSADDVLNEVQSMAATATGTFYVIGVPVGHEPEMIEAYSADPDVAQAIFSTEGVGAGAEPDFVVDNGEGTDVPDTAMARATGAPASVIAASIVALVILMGGGAVIATRRH